MTDNLRNYPSPWWQLWLQRAALIAVGLWAALGHAWFAVASAVFLLALHTWTIHKARQRKVALDAWFEDIMRKLS